MDENVPIVTDYYDHNRLKIKGLYTENIEGIYLQTTLKNQQTFENRWSIIWFDLHSKKYIISLEMFTSNQIEPNIFEKKKQMYIHM